MLGRLSFQLIIHVFLFLSVSAQKQDFKQLDEYMNKLVDDWKIPGMSVGIVQDGRLVFARGYGVLEEGKSDRPDPNSLYAIASNSKAFTSAVIAMLVQDGIINWNDKVQKYLPYFELYDPAISKMVTVKDLLCHRVGLGTFSGDIIWYNADLSSEEIIRRIKYLPNAYEFRDGYGYSNLMYITAGELIKKVTGKSWFENVEERILKPLGMDRTTIFIDSLSSLKNYATPHRLENGKNIPMRWTPWEEIAATGGLISSVEDLSRWLIFNLNHGIWKTDTLLTSGSRNILWTPANDFTVNRVNNSSSSTQLFAGYALGWGIRDYYGHLRVSHTGGYDGMITAINLIPEQNLGVIVLTNGMKSPISPASLYAIDYMLGREERDWSAEMLQTSNENIARDTRISNRIAARVTNTTPGFTSNQIAGVYRSDIYGEIRIKQEEDQIKLEFEHTPLLAASLSHWQNDEWKINWTYPHAWFSFGTVTFKGDRKTWVTEMEFDVPNDDFWFEELKPYKIR